MWHFGTLIKKLFQRLQLDFFRLRLNRINYVAQLPFRPFLCSAGELKSVRAFDGI
jgi:hypothetical protein